MDETIDAVELSENVIQFLDALAEDLFAEDMKKYHQGKEECQKPQRSKN